MLRIFAAVALSVASLLSAPTFAGAPLAQLTSTSGTPVFFDAKRITAVTSLPLANEFNVNAEDVPPFTADILPDVRPNRVDHPEGADHASAGRLRKPDGGKRIRRRRSEAGWPRSVRRVHPDGRLEGVDARLRYRVGLPRIPGRGDPQCRVLRWPWAFAWPATALKEDVDTVRKAIDQITPHWPTAFRTFS
ncbi:hypothetical protein J2R76_003993 [Bradyrhizobium sp. USDA 4532]|uniref:hypothetical protein n=1 Tax=unclassified Bradyrhizobium TaxID=2631580 RepID=UPI0020A0311A|nr:MULTISPECIES: hypothetical protein [unclassified Bradyrhizobium]MCP1835653.1 hypothetical protein [Bradyrhizobium sp. USDA 4545]MCP1920402.1 hypothetical protein [Bradyrhizobium sp. USDA 4532]